MKRKMTLYSWSTVVVCLGMVTASQGAVLRVDRDVSTCKTGCDGSDWDAENVFEYVQDALIAAGTGAADIWVADGTYLPTEQNCDNDGDCTGGTCISEKCSFTLPRAETFTLKNGVDLYGGFEGNETVFGDRDLFCSGGDNDGRPCEVIGDCPGGTSCLAHATILSGDIGTVDIHTDNSYHVVTYETDNVVATLDGFIVKRGYADGTTYNTNQGGAVHIRHDTKFCISGGPTLSNCIFRDNYASNHAAVNDHGHTTKITNCVFDDNKADRKAGALNVEHGNTEVTDCFFKNNKAQVSTGNEGGAVWLGVVTGNSSCTGSDPGKPTFTNCLFTGNKTQGGLYGGGGAIWTEATELTVVECSFSANEAIQIGPDTLYGGAIYVAGGDANIVNSQFTNNKAEVAGGAVYGLNADVTFVNTLFTGNATTNTSGGEAGGAVFIQGSGATGVFTNCTIADNSTDGNGGGIKVSFGAITADNCILFDNTDKDGQDEEAQVANFNGTVTVTYSDWEGHTPDTDGNINSDPKFVDATNGDYSLDDTCSPCVDAGQNSALPADWGDVDDDGNTTEEIPWDLAGNTRRVDDSLIIDTGGGTAPIVDMGAYERSTSSCTSGDVCCSGTCTEGDCCADGDCSSPTGRCCNNVCEACCADGDCAQSEVCCANNCCDSGEVCCNDTCTAVECCADSDCPLQQKCCLSTNECHRCCDDSECPPFKPCCIGGVCSGC